MQCNAVKHTTLTTVCHWVIILLCVLWRSEQVVQPRPLDRCHDPLNSQKGLFRKNRTFISAAGLLLVMQLFVFVSIVAAFDKISFQSRQNQKITARFFCLVSESLSFIANKTLNRSQTPFCWHCWHGDGQSLDCWGGSGEGLSVARGRPPPPSSPGWAWGVGGRP